MEVISNDLTSLKIKQLSMKRFKVKMTHYPDPLLISSTALCSLMEFTTTLKMKRSQNRLQKKKRKNWSQKSRKRRKINVLIPLLRNQVLVNSSKVCHLYDTLILVE